MLVDQQSTLRAKDPISDVTVRRVKFNKSKGGKKKGKKKTGGLETRVPETMDVERSQVDTVAPAEVGAEADKEWVPHVRVQPPIGSDRRLRSHDQNLSMVNHPPMSTQISLDEKDLMEANHDDIKSLTNDL